MVSLPLPYRQGLVVAWLLDDGRATAPVMTEGSTRAALLQKIGGYFVSPLCREALQRREKPLLERPASTLTHALDAVLRGASLPGALVLCSPRPGHRRYTSVARGFSNR